MRQLRGVPSFIQKVAKTPYLQTYFRLCKPPNQFSIERHGKSHQQKSSSNLSSPYNQSLVKTIHTKRPLIQLKAHKHIYKTKSFTHKQISQKLVQIELAFFKTKRNFTYLLTCSGAAISVHSLNNYIS